MLDRYPKAKVVWSANDPMALGALEGMKERGIKAGKDMIIGSMDWDPEALEAVQQNKLVVTINGHFMEAAWITVLLYDYFHSQDFSKEKLSFSSRMGALTKKNIENYLLYFKSEIHNFTTNDSKFCKLVRRTF